jgi:hypothetical protein
MHIASKPVRTASMSWHAWHTVASDLVAYISSSGIGVLQWSQLIMAFALAFVVDDYVHFYLAVVFVL